MVPVLIALGSNLGDSVRTLEVAVAQLAGVMRVDRVSSWIITPPMYLLDQPPFVNGALVGVTDLGPMKLLSELKRIEQALGRQVRVRNGPRELDLDLIAYGSLTLASPPLEIPHPRLAERQFVLEPLNQIAPEFVIPGFPSIPAMLTTLLAVPDDFIVAGATEPG